MTLATLGSYAEHGKTITATCERCQRTLPVTLEILIEVFGADWDFVDKKPPIKCAACGSRKIAYMLGSSGPEHGPTLGHSQ